MGRGDTVWLWPVGAITAAEVAAVFVIRSHTGYADLPPYRGYFVLALVVSLAIATMALVAHLFRLYLKGEAHPARQLATDLRTNRRQLILYFVGFQVVGIAMASVNGLKSMLTYVAPFWADPVFADWDRALFGTDPWRISHAWLGPSTSLIDQIYGLWIPIKALTMVALIASPPSRLKAQALISQAVMWALLGTVLAYALSSAGPIFYERVTGDPRFAELPIDTGLVAGRVSEYLWAGYASGHVGFGSGISAMPSLHVAIAVWTAYILSRFGRAFAILGWAYALVIFVGSIHLGWHYALDGIVSAIAAVAVWKATGLYLDRVGMKESHVQAAADDPADPYVAPGPVSAA